jgi:FMN-dependent NADH-azoreductase
MDLRESLNFSMHRIDIKSDAMKTLLKLTTSIFGENGASTQLAGAFVTRWLATHPGATLIERDLAADPVPHLTGEAFTGFGAEPGAHSPTQLAAVATSDALIDELKRADILVLGLPMYNFGIPSTLKAYFDYVGRAGLTFRYTEKGPEGLLKGKKAYVFATRGGRYSGSASETETSYVRQFLSFLGIEDIEFVYAEGLGMGDESRTAALESAADAIAAFTAPSQRAA